MSFSSPCSRATLSCRALTCFCSFSCCSLAPSNFSVARSASWWSLSTFAFTSSTDGLDGAA